MKTHWKNVFDSPYLGSWDLEDYKPIILTIKEVKVEMTKDLKENSKMNICYFKEAGVKPMLLNSGNSKAIAMVAKSPYIDNWGGVAITVYVQTGVKAFGEIHDALRIKNTAPIIKKPELTPASNKWELAKGKVKEGMTIEELRKHYDISDENFKLLK